MVPFELELELENKLLKISAEQVDRLADTEGFIRFDVTADERRSVIHVNVENDLPFLTLQDAEAYFEAINYPEQVTAFSEEEVFTYDEVITIGNAIQKYNRELKIYFDRFMSHP